jgi:hypothetical protein
VSEPATTASGRPAGTAGPARVAIVGAGALAAEVVRNLGLVGIPAAVHSPDGFWKTLHLAELQECYCAVAAGIEPDARRRLNGLCQVAGVDFVNLRCDAEGISVETFPFGSDAGCACLECAPRGADPVTRREADPISTSVAGALGAAAALHCSGHGARRLLIRDLHEASESTALQRRDDCPACASPWRAPRVIRTRNRWSAPESLTRETAQLGNQTVHLSDPIVVTCECTACGPVPELAARINRPAPGGGAVIACPGCGSTPLRIETRAAFSLDELTARFGRRPVPAKFALATIAGVPVCFDLEAASALDAAGTA